MITNPIELTKLHIYDASLVIQENNTEELTRVSDVCLRITQFLNTEALEIFMQVSKRTKNLVFLVNEERRKKVSGIAFGVVEWLSWYDFNIPFEPLLPHNIIEVLENSSPLSDDCKVKDSHTLKLIPQGMSEKIFGEIGIKKFPTTQGYNKSSNIDVINALDKPVVKSYWVIMTKDVIFGSRGLNFKSQLNLVAKFSLDLGFNYRAPKSLEAIISILSHKARSGECRFHEYPWTYTRYLNVINDAQVVIGGCGFNGVCVSTEFYIRVYYGMAGVLECLK